MKVELDLSNYATKECLKNARGVETVDLKSKVDKSDNDKLKRWLKKVTEKNWWLQKYL